MPKRNENLTKAYSRRVRLSRLWGQKRTQGEYTDNYYQGVCSFAHTPPLLLTLCALRALHLAHHLSPLHQMQLVHQCTRHTTAVRPRNRMERAGRHTVRDLVRTSPISPAPQAAPFVMTQVAPFNLADRALHDVHEIHQWLSRAHHHRSRWASKPATGARCHRSTRALIGDDRGNRRRAVTGLRRNT